MTINYGKHKNILLQILKDIYADASIASCLGFKGGTAAYLFYDLDRDSVDLDFDLLDQSQEQVVFERIKKIVAVYGQVVESIIKRFNLLHVISYETQAQNIKIEVNRRNINSRYEMQIFLGVSMLVMVKEDMFAHKLMAMQERIGKTSRDIYDVWFFLKNNWPINHKIIEDRSGLSFSEFMQKGIKQLEKMNNRNILAGLGELLDKPKKDWVKAKLKEETIFLLKARLETEK